MRTLSIAAAALAMTLAGGAVAQQRPVPHAPGAGMRPGQAWHGQDWGARTGDHWWGGMRAPGGWGAYRRPSRGYVLPSYWVAPGWAITDWRGYGLAQPPAGYGWSRYYDDAVLIDSRGLVWDRVGGLDWDGAGYGGGYEDGYAAGGYADSGYGAEYPYPTEGRRRGHDNGVAGAVIGGAAGAVAGGAIAGRHDRLGGALIGGGLGAAAGYAIGHEHDGYRDGGRGYEGPVGGYGPGGWNGPSVVHTDGGTTVTTVTSGGGYYGGGATTVVVESAPVVTTTTTEIYDDEVTYTRVAPRRRVVHHRRAAVPCPRPKPRPVCHCRPGAVRGS